MPPTAQALTLADAATRNLSSYLEHVTSRARGGRTSVRDGLVVFAGGHRYPGPYTNGMIRMTPSMSSSACLDRARAFFQPMGRGFVVWARNDSDEDLVEACRTKGYAERPPTEGNALLACLSPVAERPIPGDCELLDVVDDVDRYSYLDVVLSANGLAGVEQAVGERMLLSVDSMRNCRLTMVRLDGEAVAGCLSFTTSDGVGGAHWAATVEHARGRGLGGAVSARAVNQSFADGAQVVTVLSSGVGLSLWRSLGFREVGRYKRFLVPPPARI